MDGIAVDFAHVEVGYYGRDGGVGDVVCGAPDLGGGGWGVGLYWGEEEREVWLLKGLRKRKGGKRGG